MFNFDQILMIIAIINNNNLIIILFNKKRLKNVLKCIFKLKLL